MLIFDRSAWDSEVHRRFLRQSWRQKVAFQPWKNKQVSRHRKVLEQSSSAVWCQLHSRKHLKVLYSITNLFPILIFIFFAKVVSTKRRCLISCRKLTGSYSFKIYRNCWINTSYLDTISTAFIFSTRRCSVSRFRKTTGGRFLRKVCILQHSNPELKVSHHKEKKQSSECATTICSSTGSPSLRFSAASRAKA